MSDFPLGHRDTLWTHNAQKDILVWVHKEGPLPMSEILDRLNYTNGSSASLASIALFSLMGDGGILTANDGLNVDYA